MATTPEFTLDRPEGVRLAPPDHRHIEARIQQRRLILGGGTRSAGSQSSLDDTPTSYDDMVASVRDRRRMQKVPYVAPAYRSSQSPIRPGQAILGDIIEREAATLSQGERNVRIVPLDENQRKEQERASRMERWIRAAILGAPGRPSKLAKQAGEDWFRLGMEAALGDGRGIWECLPREDRWSMEYGHPDREDADYRGEGGDARYNSDKDRFLKMADFPFELNRVDTLCYHEVRQGGRVVEVVKIEKRAKRTIYPRYGIRPTDQEGVCEYGEPYPEEDAPSSVEGECQVVTYWRADPKPRWRKMAGLDRREAVCDTVWVVEVDGCRVDGGYSYGPPWHPLGYFAFHGTDTSLPDPMMKAVGVAFRLIRITDAIDELINMKMIVARWASMPAWAKTTPEGGYSDVNAGAAGAAAAAVPSAASSGFMGNFTLEMGKGYEMYPGQKIEAITWPQHAITILESLKNDLTELANLLGLPPIMRGDIPNAGAAGYLAAQLIAQAKTALAPALDNATAAMHDLIQWVLWQVEHRFEEGVPIWYTSSKRGSNLGGGKSYGGEGSWNWLTPEVVDGRYDMELTLEPLLPVDKIQKAEASLNQVQARAISMRRHREEGLELEDPDEEEEQIHAEELLQSPLLKLPRQVRAAIRLGYLEPAQGVAFLTAQLGIPPGQAAQQAGVVLGPNGQPISGGVALPTPTQSAVPGAGPDISQLATGIGAMPGMALPLAPTPPNPGGIPQVAGAPGVPAPQPNRAAQAI